MHPIFQLPNGIKFVHKQVDSPISHIGVLVNAGTRDEEEKDVGLAHFVEHTLFKGTEKRDARQIFRYIENLGGDMNASTSKEETYLHASFLTPDLKKITELLSDIFFNATFPEKELEKEKTIIIEEINYYKDTPTELIFDDFETLIFDQHPLGRNILGTKKGVKQLTRNHILNFIKNNYSADNVVISFVGATPLNRVKEIVSHYFGNVNLPENQRVRTPFQQYHHQTVKKNKNNSQAHLVMGNIAYSIQDDKKNHLLLLSNLLGGQGSNTRLNMEIREKRGWAYSVESFYTPLSDSGLFTIYLGCDHSMVNKSIEVIHKEFKKLREKKLGEMQLHYAKKQFLGQLAISNEQKINEMLALGRSALFFDEIETLEEAIQAFEAITADQLLDVANEILLPDNFSYLSYQKD